MTRRPSALAAACLGLAAAQDGAPIGLDGARDATGEGLAFVELWSPRAVYYAGEPIPLRLRFGLDAEFLRTRAVQPFRRELDVPAQVQWALPPELALAAE